MGGGGGFEHHSSAVGVAWKRQAEGVRREDVLIELRAVNQEYMAP